MKRVAVLMGGMGAEREVSLKSGAAVAEALRRKGHGVVEIDAGRDLARRLDDARPDVAFIALHGRWGEDGTVQGLLELMGIPYTGSGVLASALAMDKVRSKALFEALGIPTPPYGVVGPGGELGRLGWELPAVVKPTREGSTIGVSVARTAEEMSSAIRAARAYGPDVLVEKFIKGRELTVGILEGEPLPLVEVIPESGIYDYEAKYTPGRTRYVCPAPLGAAEAKAVTEAATAAARALGCSGAPRVDVIIDGSRRPWVLEVNTIPGMTQTSLLPKGAAAAGIGFDDLVERILAGAGLRA